MSGLPFMTFSAPGVPLYAPASGGGGGSVGPNPAFSSITVATGAILCPSTNISLISPGVNVSSLNVSSINGGPLNAFSNLEVSGFLDAPAISGQLRLQADTASQGSGAQLLYISSSINTASILLTPTTVNVLDATLTASNANINSGLFSTLGSVPGGPNNINVTGNLTMTGGVIYTGSLGASSITTGAVSLSSINGNNATNLAYQNGPAFFSSLGADVINAKIANTTPGATSTLVALGMYGNAGVTPFNWIQAGYVEGVPYQSTVLFKYPYPDDNSLPTVIITPTNLLTETGNNPNYSLNASFGISGVSSIGFSVDSRNAGLGFPGTFYWMAVPVTQ